MSKQTDKVIELIVNDITYLPSYEQRKSKSAFWLRWQQLEIPPCDPRDITLTVAQQLVTEPKLDRWWGEPGFSAWFRNAEEFRERVEFLANLALDAVTDILVSEDPKMASAKVNAAKLMLEVARKMPKKEAAAPAYADKKIQDMTREELEKYIAARTALLSLPPQQ